MNESFIIEGSTLTFDKNVQKISSIEFHELRFSEEEFEDILGIKEEFIGIETIILPDNLKTIGTNAFRGFKNLSQIKIPPEVTKIGNHAFEGCEKLEEIVLPENLLEIGVAAFKGCINLTSITIPSNVSVLPKEVFRDCIMLEKIAMSDNVKEIGFKTFENTMWLQNLRNENPYVIFNGILIDGQEVQGDVVIPDTVRAISDGAFYANSKITSVEIGANVKKVGFTNSNDYGDNDKISNGVFEDCCNLKSILIFDGVYSIGDLAFQNCEELNTITIPNSVDFIGKYAFDYTDCMIVCKRLSYVEKYAKKNRISYKNIEDLLDTQEKSE